MVLWRQESDRQNQFIGTIILMALGEPWKSFLAAAGAAAGH